MSRSVWLLLGVGLSLVYAAAIGRHGLLEPDEARYAEVAREMRKSGDFLLPTLNGFGHFQKPPVFYWSVAAGMAVFGENEIGARIAPLLSALGVLLLTGIIGRIWLGQELGRIAVWLLGSMVLFFVLGRSVCPDMTMTFWSTAAIACFAYATRMAGRTNAWIWGYFACMGVAFATKGPMGVIVPLATGLGWQHANHRASELRARISWLAGLLLTAVLALAWFGICIWKHPELGQYFWNYEFVGRIFSRTHGRSQPFWFFIPVLMLGCQPWTFLLLLAFPFGKRHAPRACGSRSVRDALIAWVWPPFLVLAFGGSKLMTYILPLMPGLALWMALRLPMRLRSRGLAVAVLAQIALLTLVGAGVLLAVLNPSLLPAPIAFDRWFAPAWLIVILAALLTLWSMRNGVTEGSIVRMSFASLLVWLTLATQLVNVNALLGVGASLRPLAAKLQAEPGWESAQIIVAGTRRHGLEFYLRRLVDNTRPHADIVLPPLPADARRLHESSATLAIRDQSGTSSYVLTRKRELAAGRFPLDEWTELGRDGAFVLLRHSRPVSFTTAPACKVPALPTAPPESKP